MTSRTETPRRGLQPDSCPDLSAEVLQPCRTWPDSAAADRQSEQLTGMFRDTFETFEPTVGPGVRAAGPNV